MYVITLPRRQGFLHYSYIIAVKTLKIHQSASIMKTQLLLIQSNIFNRLSLDYIQLSFLILLFFYYLEKYLLFLHLYNSILQSIGFTNFKGVIAAINTLSANKNMNYQHFKFLGNTALKFFAVTQIFTAHTIARLIRGWPKMRGAGGSWLMSFSALVSKWASCQYTQEHYF